MARIALTNGFTVCPEGEHIFRIYKVDYDNDFGKLTICLVNAQGITHQERFSLMREDGSMNEGACNAFSYFAKTALNNYAIEEIDHSELVNRYIEGTIEHTIVPSKNDPNKNVTFAHLSNYEVAEGFNTTPVAKALTLGDEGATAAPPVPPATTTTGLDLNSLLG